jgi:bifunctional DNA-binding transcriptional regulator/antitoxin component of YhaV-PrlF toxin-antitoxin module
MARKLVYIRSRNQITLPAEVVSHLDVGKGDYLQVEIAPGGRAQLAPARLATLGTPEADEQNRRADEDIKAGRFRIFKDAESFSRFSRISSRTSRPFARTAPSKRLRES